MDLTTDPGPVCLRMASLVTRFHAGESDLQEVDLILGHVPGCERCSTIYDGLGKELGVVTNSWEESLTAYDPAKMLEEAESMKARDPGKLPFSVSVMLGKAWEGARNVAQGVLDFSRLSAAPVFRSGAAAPQTWRGRAGAFDVTLALHSTGAIDISVLDARGVPQSGGRVRLEKSGKTIVDVELDSTGNARLAEPPDEQFDSLRILTPS